MALTAGTALQNGKYIIQSVLEEQATGTVYQAFHTFLEQPVVLQTLTTMPRDRVELVRVQHAFLAGVRRLTRETGGTSVKVLDCFNEGVLPFVVLERIPGQPLPRMEEWLKLEEAGSATVSYAVSDPANGSEQAPREANPPRTEATTLPVSLAATESGNGHSPSRNGAIARATAAPITEPPSAVLSTIPTVAVAPSQTVPSGTALATDSKTAIATAAAAAAKPPAGRAIGVSPSRPKRRVLPIVLLFTSVLGSLVGAGFGLALRFEDSGQPRTVNDPIFSKDQNFPPLSGWSAGAPNASEFSESMQEESEPDLIQSPQQPERSIGDRPLVEPVSPQVRPAQDAPTRRERVKDKHFQPEALPPAEPSAPVTEKLIPPPEVIPQPEPQPEPVAPEPIAPAIPEPAQEAPPPAPEPELIPPSKAPEPPAKPADPSPSAYDFAPTVPGGSAPVVQ